MFPQNVAEAVTVIFPREVLEEDGDLKKRMIGTGPFILKEHDRKVKVVLTRNPDYFDKGIPTSTSIVFSRPPMPATRLAAFRTGQSDILVLQSLADVENSAQDQPTAVVEEVANVLAPFGLALRQTNLPSTTCGSAGPSRWPSIGKSRSIPLYEGHAFLAGDSVFFTGRRNCPPPPTSARIGNTARRRKEAAAEAGYPHGFETTLFYYEYFPQMTSKSNWCSRI